MIHRKAADFQVKSFTLIFLALLIFYTGCATHPTVSPKRLTEGESRYGYTLSIENVFPVMWYRKGISDVSDIGFRIGLPVYGTGIDYSRLLYSKDNKWDVMNLSWSLNPNYNMDFTYYKFKEIGENRFRWWGFRGMYIPEGIMGNTSTRIGVLYGRQIKDTMGFEVGYYHDFSSMPLTSVVDPGWAWDSDENIGRYGDTPHTSDAGIPSEFSRMTGLSMMVYFQLGSTE